MIQKRIRRDEDSSNHRKLASSNRTGPEGFRFARHPGRRRGSFVRATSTTIRQSGWKSEGYAVLSLVVCEENRLHACGHTAGAAEIDGGWYDDFLASSSLRQKESFQCVFRVLLLLCLRCRPLRYCLRDARVEVAEATGVRSLSRYLPACFRRRKMARRRPSP